MLFPMYVMVQPTIFVYVVVFLLV
nr:unnamed protein product [Callosobruchus chinensis]